MYEQKHLALALDGTFLRIPNWVLREIGVLQHEVTLDGAVLRARDRSLPVGAVAEAPGATLVGDLAYASEGAVLDLGALLARPALWLGNEALRRFLGDEAFISLVSRRRKGASDFRLDARVWPRARAGAAAAAARRRRSRRGQLLVDPRGRRAAPRRAARGAPRHQPPAHRPRRRRERARRPLPRPAPARRRRARRGRAPPRLPRAAPQRGAGETLAHAAALPRPDGRDGAPRRGPRRPRRARPHGRAGAGPARAPRVGQGPVRALRIPPTAACSWARCGCSPRRPSRTRSTSRTSGSRSRA